MTQHALQCVCERQGCLFPANVRRQDTAYTNDKLNWAAYCTECQAEVDDYWRERWADYYGDTIV